MWIVSLKNVEKFFELVKSNKNIAEDLIKVKDKLQQKDKILDEIQFVKDEIIPLAQKNGIDFAPEEFLNYVKTQISELSDEDLLNVSGGGNFQNFLLGGLLVALSSVAPVVGISNFKLVENVAQETTQNSEINTQTGQGGDDSEAASAKAKSDAQNDGSSKKKTGSKTRSSQNANKNKAAGKARGNSLNRAQPSSHRRAPQNGSAVSAGLQGDVENLSQPQLSTPADVSAAPSVPTGSEVSQNNSVKSFTSQPQNAPTPNIKTDVVNPAPEPTPAPQPTVNSAPAPEPVVKPINNEVEPEPAPQPNIKSDPAPDPAPVPPVEPKYNDVHRGWTAERARALAIYLRNNFDLSTFSEAVLDSETENSLKDFLYNCEVTKKGTFIHGVRIDNEDAATLFSYCAEKYDYIFGTNKNIKDKIVKTFIINKDPENFVDFAESLGRDGLNDLKILVNTWQEMKRSGEYTEYPQLRKDVYKSASQFISKARELIKAKNSVNKEIKDIIQEDEAAISASSFRWQKISFWAKSLVIGTVLAYLTYKYGDTIYGFVNDIKNHVVSLFHKGTPFSNMVNDTVDHFENQCLSNGIIPTNITTNTTPLANGSNFVKNIYNIAKKSTALVDKNNATNFISTNYNPAIQENINKFGEQLISQPGSSTSVALVSQGMQKIDAPGVAQKVEGLVEYGKSIGSTVANYLTNWGSSGTNVATSVNKIATGSAVVDPSNPPADLVGTAVKKGSSLVEQSMQNVDAPSLLSLTQYGVNTIKKAGNAISSLGGQVLDKRDEVFASIKNSLYSIVGDAPTFAKAVTDSNGMLPANLETLEKGVKITANTLNPAAAVNPSAIASTINKGVEVAANTLKQGGSGAINLATAAGKEALNSLVEIGKSSFETGAPISVAKEVVDNPLAFNYGPLNMIKEAAEKSGWNFKKIGLTAVGLASSLFSVFGGGVFATRNKIHCTGAFEDYATGLSLGISNSNELDISKYSEEIQQFIKEEMIKSLLFCNEDSAKLPAKQLNTILISSDESENNFNLAVKNLSKSSNLRSATKPYVLVPLVLKQKNDTKDRSKVTSATMNVYVDDCVCTFSWNSAKPDQINFSKPDDCPNVSEEKLENAKQLFCREIGLKNKSDNDLDVTLGTKDYSNAILSKWTSADVVSFAKRFNFDADENLPRQIFMDLRNIVKLIQIETNGIATINGKEIPEESFIKVLNIARDHLMYYDCKSSYSSSELMKFVMVNKNIYFDDETTSVAEKLKQMKNSGTFKNTPKFILEKINWVLVEAGLEKPEEPAAPADAVLPIDKEREKQEERKVTFTIPVADEKNSEKTTVAPKHEDDRPKVEAKKTDDASGKEEIEVVGSEENNKDEKINNLDTSAEEGSEDKTATITVEEKNPDAGKKLSDVKETSGSDKSAKKEAVKKNDAGEAVITTDEEKVHDKDKKLGGGESPSEILDTLHVKVPSEEINAEKDKAGSNDEAAKPEDNSLHSEESGEEKNEAEFSDDEDYTKENEEDDLFKKSSEPTEADKFLFNYNDDNFEPVENSWNEEEDIAEAESAKNKDKKAPVAIQDESSKSKAESSSKDEVKNTNTETSKEDEKFNDINNNDFGPGPGGPYFGSDSDHGPNFEGSENDELTKSDADSLHSDTKNDVDAASEEKDITETETAENKDEKEVSDTNEYEKLVSKNNSYYKQLTDYMLKNFPMEKFEPNDLDKMNSDMASHFDWFSQRMVVTKKGILLPHRLLFDKSFSPPITLIDDNVAATLCTYLAYAQPSYFITDVNKNEYGLSENEYGKPIENEAMRCFLSNISPQDIFDNAVYQGIDGLENLKALLETYKKMQGSGILAQYPQFMQDRANIFASELEQFIKEKESELNNNNDGSDSESSTGGSDFDSGSDFGPGSNGGGNNKTQQENNKKSGNEATEGSGEEQNKSVNTENQESKETTPTNDNAEKFEKYKTLEQTDPNHPLTPRLNKVIASLEEQRLAPKSNKGKAQTPTDTDENTGTRYQYTRYLTNFLNNFRQECSNSLGNTSPKSNKEKAQTPTENKKQQNKQQPKSAIANEGEQTSNNNSKKDDDDVEGVGNITEEKDNQNASKWTSKRVQDLYNNLGSFNGDNKLSPELRQELYDFFDDVEVVPDAQEMTFKVGNVSIKGAAAQRFHELAPYSNVVYNPNASDRIKELSRYVMFSGRGTLDKMENYSNKYGKWAENSAGAKENVKAFINDFRKLMTLEELNKLPIWEQEEFKKHNKCINDIYKNLESSLNGLAISIFNQKWSQEKVDELVNAVSSDNSESDLVNEWTLINFLKNIDVDYENRSGLAFKLHVNNSNDIINVTEEQAKILRENISKHVRIWFNPIFVRDSEKISKENKIEISEKEKIKLALKCVAFNNGYRDLRLATQHGEFKLIKSKNSKDNARKNLIEAEKILEGLSSKSEWKNFQSWAKKMAIDFTWSQERVNNVFTLIEKEINGISSVKVIPKEQKEISQFVNNLVILGKSEKPKFAIGIKYILDEQAQTIIDLKGKVNLDITFNPYAKDKEMEALRCTTLSPDFLSMQGNLATHFGDNNKKVNEVLVDFLDTLINVQNKNTVSKYKLWVQESFNKYIESITTYLNVENLKGAKEKLTAESSNLK